MNVSGDLRGAAQAWAAHDPEPGDVAQVQAMLEAGDEAGLTRAFAEPLAFGTAGIRGRRGPGPAQVNTAVMRVLGASLAGWLDDGYRVGSVVIGRDARHRSDALASELAGAIAATGRNVVVGRTPLPTPVIAFAVKSIQASSGLVVTASHNPPDDSGVKVFGPDARQIVSPVDAEIAARMVSGPHADAIPFVPASERFARVHLLAEATVDAYLRAVAGLRRTAGRLDVTTVHSALHGVGHRAVQRAFEIADIRPPVAVTAQADPDPDFPTVVAPNPQLPGVLDRVVALAARVGADLAIANDPDADRLAAVIPDQGGWRILTGDEIGALLGDHLFTHLDPDVRDRAVVATSLVSSGLVRRMARAAGLAHVQTLTGFKWLSRAADGIDGGDLLYAYEEALGYGFGPAAGLSSAGDKDGIAAAVLLAEAVATLGAAGTTPARRLDELAVEHGLHATAQRVFPMRGTRPRADLRVAMDRLRSRTPATLGPASITVAEDLAAGSADLPPAEALVWWGPEVRVVVRPSGTEPVLKAYAEVVRPVAQTTEVRAARIEAEAAVDAVLRDVAAALG